jgi:hypothetical protein
VEVGVEPFDGSVAGGERRSVSSLPVAAGRLRVSTPDAIE